jgi:putative transposase
MPELRRKPIRLEAPYYCGYRSYFVTVCTKNRRKLFDCSPVVESLLSILREQTIRFQFSLYAYCFMPDHGHFLLKGKSPDAELSEMIRAFKGCSTAVLRRFKIRDAWQKGYYEHILRTGEDHASVTAYIFENPVRAGLAKDIYAWPFSGSFVFEWREFQSPVAKFVPPYKAGEDRWGRQVATE